MNTKSYLISFLVVLSIIAISACTGKNTENEGNNSNTELSSRPTIDPFSTLVHVPTSEAGIEGLTEAEVTATLDALKSDGMIKTPEPGYVQLT